MLEKTILTEEEIKRALTRIAHEIVERNRGVKGLILVGIYTRGVPIAQRLAQKITEFEGAEVPVGTLNIGLYRDDIPERKRPLVHPTEIPVDIDDQRVVLVDDVLFTGRSIRAAMDALTDFGRPQVIQLAVLIDRGHREIPIRSDYVGKNIPTSRNERIEVRLSEVDGADAVVLQDRPEVPSYVMPRND